MSLVLNGGVGGNGTTQYAHVGSRIVSALPATVSFWFRTGVNTTSGGRAAEWVQSDATLGTYRMGAGAAQSSGPNLARTTTCRTTTSTAYSSYTAATVGVTSITSGATTQVGVDDASGFSAGEYVRLEGTFTGLTGISSGRDWRIQSIAGNTLTLTLASSGDWAEGQSATVKWSAWQPEKWNLGVATFTTTAGEFLQHKGGFVGNTSVTINAFHTGVSGQRPADIFSALDRLCLGATFQSGGATNYFRGEFAHVAVWQYAPSAAEASELLTKAPHLVGWGSPLAYAPFLADANDVIGSNHFTLVGSPSITSDGPSIQLTSGGGGGSGYLPTVMRAQPINLFGF